MNKHVVAATLRTLFTELEFHTLIDKVGGPISEPRRVTCTTVSSNADIGELVEQACRSKMIAISTQGPFGDARGAGLDGLAVSVDGDRAWYVPLRHRAPDGDLLNDTAPFNAPPFTDAAMAKLKEVLEDPKVAKAGHLGIFLHHRLVHRRNRRVGRRSVSIENDRHQYAGSIW